MKFIGPDLFPLAWATLLTNGAGSVSIQAGYGIDPATLTLTTTAIEFALLTAPKDNFSSAFSSIQNSGKITQAGQIGPNGFALISQTSSTGVTVNPQTNVLAVAILIIGTP